LFHGKSTQKNGICGLQAVGKSLHIGVASPEVELGISLIKSGLRSGKDASANSNFLEAGLGNSILGTH